MDTYSDTYSEPSKTEQSDLKTAMMLHAQLVMKVIDVLSGELSQSRLTIARLMDDGGDNGP